ncbi:MAG TPA: hypothetical protein PLT89_10480, partial [Syntrophomonadaceae bacterium]|nr:hypothetical protein [Syntrophomonadaceae bacterium]
VALKIQAAQDKVSKVTPIKGDTYENQVNIVLAEVVTGLGDEYTDTRSTVGHLPRSKKGDGLLTLDGGLARVVIEMTDSARVGWTEYLDEAEAILEEFNLTNHVFTKRQAIPCKPVISQK